jgi:hypothetical protein
MGKQTIKSTREGARGEERNWEEGAGRAAPGRFLSWVLERGRVIPD